MSRHQNQATYAVTRNAITDWDSIAHELSTSNLRAFEHWRRRCQDLAALVLGDLERGGQIMPLTKHYAQELCEAIYEGRIPNTNKHRRMFP